MRFSSLTSGMVAIVLGAFIWTPVAPVHAATVTPPESGTLIRGTTFPAVYYMGADGFRYVFPNDKTYFTWYENFNNVQWLSDADLSTIQIGGNVTYKPGEKMIKIQSDPKTYAVSQNGTLRWVTTEGVATSLYGTNWNTKIDDVPDGFFTNYTIGEPIMSASDYSATEEQTGVSSINEDKSLISAEDVTITSDDYSPSRITISAGQTVRFTNTDTEKHTATADDGSWGSGTLEAGETFLKRFDEPGTYDYFCSYHPDMQGTIEVE